MLWKAWARWLNSCSTSTNIFLSLLGSVTCCEKACTTTTLGRDGKEAWRQTWVEASSLILARKASIVLWASVSLTYDWGGYEASVPTNARNCSSFLIQAVWFQSLWKRHSQRK